MSTEEVGVAKENHADMVIRFILALSRRPVRPNNDQIADIRKRSNQEGHPWQSSHLAGESRGPPLFVATGPRPATRLRGLLIDVMPRHARICDECLMVFWERLFAGELTFNGAKRPRY
jgi:hypothetical protein